MIYNSSCRNYTPIRRARSDEFAITIGILGCDREAVPGSLPKDKNSNLKRILLNMRVPRETCPETSAHLPAVFLTIHQPSVAERRCMIMRYFLCPYDKSPTYYLLVPFYPEVSGTSYPISTEGPLLIQLLYLYQNFSMTAVEHTAYTKAAGFSVASHASSCNAAIHPFSSRAAYVRIISRESNNTFSKPISLQLFFDGQMS